MDVAEQADSSWTDNRREVMSQFLMRMSEFFCPSDRELALRGQIKTGWSTVAARKKCQPSQMKLPPQEIKHIKAVVAQAEALQVAEELRIGVQMMQLQRLRNSCRGNGTSTCVLCGYDLVHHRSRSLSTIHVCYECAQAVCSRCKAEYKNITGEKVVLCRLCSDERELWKKSGAWLSNKLPVINISEEELEKAQLRQRQMAQKMMPLRTDFMVPVSQLDEDDDELEDGLSVISGSTANYGGFSSFRAGSTPSSRSPSPDMSFMPEGNAAAAAWRGDRLNSAELHPQSYKTLPHHGKNPTAMRKSGSYDLVAVRKQRSSTLPSKERGLSLSRKPAMGGERKKDMEELRRKVVEKKKAAEMRKSAAIEIQRTPSPTLHVDPLRMKRSRSNDFPVARNPQLSPVLGSAAPHPHIKVVVATPPASPDPHHAEPRSESPLMESTVARETTHRSHDSETNRAASVSQNISQQVVERRKRKPVPSPRRVPSPDPEPQRQQDTAEPAKLVAETRRHATIEREKPSAAPRKRAGSLDKEKGREYRSDTLERRQRGGRRTPEPQPSESKTGHSKKAGGVGESRSIYSAVLPADVSSELKSALSKSKKEASSHEEDQSNPRLKEIGKTFSITSEGSVDSQHRGGGEGVTRADSGSSGEYTWKRQRARRTRHTNHTEQEEEDHSPRSRARSRAVSGEAGKSRSQQIDEDDKEAFSRSRTRSGAVSGGDAPALRRGRNVRVSPRPGHRHSGASVDGYQDPPLPIEHYGSEEAEAIRRARAGERRVGRTGGDLLIATDGEQRN